jgi:hypothetical protein
MLGRVEATFAAVYALEFGSLKQAAQMLVSGCCTCLGALGRAAEIFNTGIA